MGFDEIQQDSLGCISTISLDRISRRTTDVVSRFLDKMVVVTDGLVEGGRIVGTPDGVSLGNVDRDGL